MHILQPKHVKLSPHEAEKVLAKFNTSWQQLPGIKKKDPAIVSLEVKRGDVIKIVRKSENGEEIYYRVVL